MSTASAATGGEATHGEYARAYEEIARRIRMTGFFKRLAGKTQAFSALDNQNRRMRMTHTLDVLDFALRLVRRIGPEQLDVADLALARTESPRTGPPPSEWEQLWLTTAIALGHDLGHTPFGHAGEAGLHDFLRKRTGTGFHHNWQSLRVLLLLEAPTTVSARTGPAWGRPWTAVLDGILNHTRPEGTVRNVPLSWYEDARAQTDPLGYPNDGLPGTAAGVIVAVADEVCGRVHDVEDALAEGVVEPGQIAAVLGRSPGRPRVALPRVFGYHRQYGWAEPATLPGRGELRNEAYHDRLRLSLDLLSRYESDIVGAWAQVREGAWRSWASRTRSEPDKDAYRAAMREPLGGAAELDRQLYRLVKHSVHEQPEVLRRSRQGSAKVARLTYFLMENPQYLRDWWGEAFAKERGCEGHEQEKACTPRRAGCRTCQGLRRIADYVAAMTDQEATKLYAEWIENPPPGCRRVKPWDDAPPLSG